MMRTWWETLSFSEQVILYVGAFMLIASAWYVFLVEPLIEARELVLARVHAARALHRDLRELGGDVRELSAQGRAYKLFERDLSMISVINQTGARTGTQGFIKRINPLGADSVSLFLDDVPFARLSAWLIALDDGYGVMVDRAVLERAQPGLVDGQLTLTARAAR